MSTCYRPECMASRCEAHLEDITSLDGSSRVPNRVISDLT